MTTEETRVFTTTDYMRLILKKQISKRKEEIKKELEQTPIINDLHSIIIENCIVAERYYLLDEYNFDWERMFQEHIPMPEINIMKHFFMAMTIKQLARYFGCTGGKKNYHQFIYKFLEYEEYITRLRFFPMEIEYELMQCVASISKRTYVNIKEFTKALDILIEKDYFKWEYYVDYRYYNNRFIKFNKKHKKIIQETIDAEKQRYIRAMNFFS